MGEYCVSALCYLIQARSLLILTTHHQLREEVDEVLREEHHRGVQGNHKAGPQSQVQIRRQLLLTHTHTKTVIRKEFILH